MIVLPI